MTRAALLLLLSLLAGCRSGYDGPSFAGAWEAGGMRLTVSQDLGAWLDAPVKAELVDAAGRAWTLKGAPERQGALGVVRGEPLRVGLRAGLTLVDDEGERRRFSSGPLPWTLVRGVLPSGEEAITLHVGQAGPLWATAPPESWCHATFRRPGARPAAPPPPAEPGERRCASCGHALEAGWRHCPMCGAGR
ncbi:MAG: hypothetical protein M9894_39570 [Planctomycetes bacterium]|nr:hypothetical protein [Planctomycetota bacterium]